MIINHGIPDACPSALAAKRVSDFRMLRDEFVAQLRNRAAGRGIDVEFGPDHLCQPAVELDFHRYLDPKSSDLLSSSGAFPSTDAMGVEIVTGACAVAEIGK
jgi:hypothetical protein